MASFHDPSQWPARLRRPVAQGGARRRNIGRRGVNTIYGEMDTVSPEQRSRNMSKVRGKNTSLEMKVRSLLHRLGYRFRLHRKDLPGTPDLVFPGRRSVIFIHGCFWHGHSCARAALPTSNRQFWETKIGRNQERDVAALARLQEAGWKVLTVWQCQTKDESALQAMLVDFLGAGTMR